MDQINLSAWIGRKAETAGGINAATAGLIHATVGPAGEGAPAPGAPLPLLWHWCAFPDPVPLGELGGDGHPKLGGFLPPVPLERRMWAGGDLTFLRPLHVDEPLTRRSIISGVVEKGTPEKPMAFVSVEHEIHGDAGLAIRERQDIVYLAIPSKFTPPRKTPVPEARAFEQRFPVSKPLLFRYSALTFNAHRIHYDWEYTRDVEHYPGLVVHGPLQATLLMQSATRFKGRSPVHFTHRGVHPMFHTDDLRLIGVEESANRMMLCTATDAGHQGLQATAKWED